MNRCLCCYGELKDGETDFHAKCAKKFFGTSKAPVLSYSSGEIAELAKRVVKSQVTIAGVQPKLSLNIERKINEVPRLTIVGLWGGYILKPQTASFLHLPENEDLTMHLAEIAGIETVPHSLIRFTDGELCYITKRIDRTKNGEKIPMEDMCQITGRLSEDKYKSSHEQIAKAIGKYSAYPGFDMVNFAEQTLFSWIVGNADMHLKNFSLYAPQGGYRLAPAYDMLNTKLAMPEDKEELALILDGKKSKLKRSNFEHAFATFGLPEKAIENVFAKFEKARPKWNGFIGKSFLSNEQKKLYISILDEQFERL